MARFSGRVAIVTGASSGIGRAVAERFSADGADLVLASHPRDERLLEETAEVLRASGAQVELVCGDQSQRATATRIVECARSAFGRLDIAIANAGFSYFEELFEAPDPHWHDIVDANLTGTYYVAVEAAREMKAGGGGVIVITASTAGHMGDELQVHYNTSKAGLIGLARSLAVALASFGIRVNAVAPGWVETPLSRSKLESPFWQHSQRLIPMRRAARPDEIANVFAFVASDEASYLTGATIVVDGGLTAGFSYPREDLA